VEGTKDDVMGATNKKLNDLVFASDLFRKVKEAELAEEEERERQEQKMQ
jgi:phospholipid/cholesterol/gamma-HCH transport system ATP-binding protein